MSGTDEVVYSAILRPHRSAGKSGARMVVLLMAMVWLPVASVFAIAGAWPVLPFLGVELVLIYALLRLNQRAGNSLEAINLTRRALTVRRVDHWGKQSSFSFAPQWLQVNIAEVARDDNRLELRSHGRSLTIASFLLPTERAALASALRSALARLTEPALQASPQPALAKPSTSVIP
jgi:uncharacterized membrane protein